MSTKSAFDLFESEGCLALENENFSFYVLDEISFSPLYNEYKDDLKEMVNFSLPSSVHENEFGSDCKNICILLPHISLNTEDNESDSTSSTDFFFKPLLPDSGKVLDLSLKSLEQAPSSKFTTSSFITHKLPHQTLSRTPTSLVVPVHDLRYSKHYLQAHSRPLQYKLTKQSSIFAMSRLDKIEETPKVVARPHKNKLFPFKSKIFLVITSLGHQAKLIYRNSRLMAKSQIKPKK